MPIEKTSNGTETILAVNGWLDTQSAPELEAALTELEEDVTSLVLDFSELEYISSAGIRQVVAAHKKTGGKLVVRNVAPEVLEVLRMAGVSDRLNIE